MSDFDDYPFQYSLPVDLTKLPQDYFHILPCRQSSQDILVDKAAIDQMKEEWIQALGDKETEQSSLDEKILSNFLNVYPECPPSKRAPVLKLATIVGLWDDVTDSLETAEHQAIVDDISLAIVSKLKTGSPTPCEHKINDLYLNTFEQTMTQLGVQGDEHTMILQGFLKMLQSQTVGPLDQMTFEAYKEQRTISCAGIFANLVIPTCHDLNVSGSEQASVLSIIKLGSLIAGLVNDFESFHKEFEEHFAADSLDVIHNAMAVLMVNYGYTEEEAKSILKEEILSLERKMLDDYEAWKSSPSSKSDDMRRYMALSVLGVGGACHVQAISPRYHGLHLITTAEDRAKLVGRNKTNYKLHGYPPPALYKHSSEGLPVIKTELPGEGEGDILAPFEKAPAEQICMAPYDYTKSMPGKKTIARFIECLRFWLDLPDDSASIIERATSMLFHSTLMIDDIEDGSLLRRGKPAAHLVFGKSQTVNSATYLYARANREIGQLQKHECSKAFLDELETLALGQSLDLYWKFQKTCPTAREYLIMVDNKTGGFFRMALRLMEIESDAESCPDLIYLVTLIGRYYQIRDDYMNLTSEEYTGTKGYCEDLSEGKFSFPLVHALQHSPAADQLRGLLFHRESGDLSIEMKQYIVSEMRDAGSLSHARDTAIRLFEAIMEALERVEAKLGPNKRLKALLLWLKL